MSPKPTKPTNPGKSALSQPQPTLEGVKQDMLALLGQGEDEHWQLGADYNTIVDNKLAEQHGYKSPRDFFTQEIKGVSPATLTRYAAVARAFPEAAAKRYGCSKLATLLTYETLAHAGPVSGDPGQVVVQVPQPDGSVQGVAFADCSESDLTSALKQLRGGSAPLPAEVVTRVQALQQALEAGFGPHHPAQVTARAKGRGVVVDLSNVPVEQLKLVLHALLDAS